MKRKISKKSEEKLLDELLAKFTTPAVPKSRKWFKQERYDWKYTDVVEAEYETVRHCLTGNNSCVSEGICRCSTIENLKLHYSHNEFVNNLTFGMSNEILIYCIDRIIRLAKINEDSFDANVQQYYYGEEIMGIYLNEETNKYVYDNISKLKSMSNVDRIKFVLNLEYLYLLDLFKDVTETQIKEIDVSKIIFNEDYVKRVDISKEQYDEKFNLPRAILLKVNDCYRLIDGYHRVMKAKSMNHTKIKAVIVQ
jgi:hypothetical protein